MKSGVESTRSVSRERCPDLSQTDSAAARAVLKRQALCPSGKRQTQNPNPAIDDDQVRYGVRSVVKMAAEVSITDLWIPAPCAPVELCSSDPDGRELMGVELKSWRHA